MFSAGATFWSGRHPPPPYTQGGGRYRNINEEGGNGRINVGASPPQTNCLLKANPDDFVGVTTAVGQFGAGRPTLCAPSPAPPSSEHPCFHGAEGWEEMNDGPPTRPTSINAPQPT